MLNGLLRGEISQNDYFNYNDITLLYTVLPKRIYGFIIRYKNRNIIAINKYISESNKKRTILHELAHLELNHLDNKKRLLEFKIQNLEDEADRYIKYLEDNL